MENNNNFKPLQPEEKKEDTKFYNTYSTSKSSSAKSSSHSFGKSVMLPFFSGLLGCSIYKRKDCRCSSIFKHF